jgi:antitoxin PrlF
MPPGSTLSSKGQITVPLEIRRRLGLKEGDRVEFVADGEQTIMRPAQAPGDPFKKYVGALPAFGSKREISAWINKMRGASSSE